MPAYGGPVGIVTVFRNIDVQNASVSHECFSDLSCKVVPMTRASSACGSARCHWTQEEGAWVIQTPSVVDVV